MGELSTGLAFWLDGGCIRTASAMGVIPNKATMGGTIFKYLFEKYKMAGSGRAFPVQKSRTSRDSVTAQSYRTNAGRDDVRCMVTVLKLMK